MESVKTRDEVLAYALSFPDTYMDAPFHDDNWQLVRSQKNKKVFLWTYERNGNIWINVKAEPEWGRFWRSLYESVIPAYHMNKEHWITVILDGTVPNEDIKKMISESYGLISGKTRKNEYA